MEGGRFVFCILLIVGYACCGAINRNEQTAEIENLRNGARIVAGWPALDGQIPYQVSVRMVSTAGAVFSCGGSVMHNKWVLTAAHCVANRITFVVRFGLTNITRPDYIVESTRKYIHPRYIEIIAGVQTDDIALIGLDKAVPYTSYIQPVRLGNSGSRFEMYEGVRYVVSGYGRTDDLWNAYIQPVRLGNSGSRFEMYEGVRYVVSGYGRTDDLWNGGAASEILLFTYLQGITNEECRTFYPTSTVIREQTICAASYNDSAQSSCQGDSGGPLTFIDSDGKVTQIGVVSFGHVSGCNGPHPAGYVRPSWYHDWFLELTGINFDWNQEDIEPEYPIPDSPEDQIKAWDGKTMIY